LSVGRFGRVINARATTLSTWELISKALEKAGWAVVTEAGRQKRGSKRATMPVRKRVACDTGVEKIRRYTL